MAKTEAPLDSFAEVAAAPAHVVRALLQSGTARERVWASWVLALALGGEFKARVPALLESEPDPGVRRHLIVILAGAGERLALRELATHDPDPYVRAAAHRYCLQVASPEAREAAIAAALTAAHSDPSATTREECLTLLSGCWPREREAELASLLRASAPGVRTAAAALLLEPPLSPSQVREVAQRALLEPVATRHDWWRALIERGFAREIVELLPGDRSLAREALLLLTRHGAHVAWEVLREQVRPADPEFERRLLDLLPHEADADLAFLADRAARGLCEGSRSGESAFLGWRAKRGLIEAARRDPTTRAEDVATRRNLERLVDLLRAEIGSLEICIREGGADASEALDDDEDWLPVGAQLLYAKAELGSIHSLLGLGT